MQRSGAFPGGPSQQVGLGRLRPCPLEADVILRGSHSDPGGQEDTASRGDHWFFRAQSAGRRQNLTHIRAGQNPGTWRKRQ